jgi:hypothetical protein
VLDPVYVDDQNIVTAGRPWNRRNRNCDRNIKCCSLRAPRGSADLKGSLEPERLVSSEARDHEGIPVHIINRELGHMCLVGFGPVDLNNTGDGEWLHGWPDLVPSAA